MLLQTPYYQPLGAIRRGDRVRWTVWAPSADQLEIVLEGSRIGAERVLAAEPLDHGYFTIEAESISEGQRYWVRLPQGQFPDPMSRWQPKGPHGPSAVFFPDDFSWNDHDWRGVAQSDLVIYELHVGTFTPEGTFDAIIPRLAELRTLGITAI